MELTPKEQAKQLLEKVRPHTQYWDCYNDCPLEEDHAKKVALICVDETIASLRTWENRYMGREQILHFFKLKEELENL
jgi:hypothetical protein